MSTPPDSGLTRGGDTRLAWIILLVLQASLVAFAVGDRRALRGRGETGEYLALQQDAREGDEIAVPPPRRDATSYFAQNGLLQQLLLGAPGFARGPARALSYLGLLADELLFLLGVWGLARSLFQDPRAAFVVVAAAAGSGLWVDHVWSNFKSFAALPLLLHLARAYRSSGSPFLLTVALNLCGVQALGQPPGRALLCPVAALCIMVAFPRVLDPHGPRTVSRARIAAAAAAGVAIWIPVALTGLAGLGEAAPRTRPSFVMSVLGFFGGDNPASLLDVGLGVAPVPDFTLYCGFFTLGFAALGLARLGPRASLRGIGAAGTVVLLTGVVAAAGDRLWPSVHGSRGAVAGAPLLRLFVAFLAGIGVEGLLRREGFTGRALPRVAASLLLIGASLLLTSIKLRYVMDLEAAAARFFVPRAPAGTVSAVFRDLGTTRELFDVSGFWSILAGVLLLAARSRRTAPLALALILCLHPADVFGWKFRMTWIRTRAEAHLEPGPPPPPQTRPRPPGFRTGLRSDVGWATASAALLGLNAFAWIAGLSAASARAALAKSPRRPIPQGRPDERPLQ
jgi:hypothetical protein